MTTCHIRDVDWNSPEYGRKTDFGKHPAGLILTHLFFLEGKKGEYGVKDFALETASMGE